jgi:hypothetical protein
MSYCSCRHRYIQKIKCKSLEKNHAFTFTYVSSYIPARFLKSLITRFWPYLPELTINVCIFHWPRCTAATAEYIFLQCKCKFFILGSGRSVTFGTLGNFGINVLKWSLTIVTCADLSIAVQLKTGEKYFCKSPPRLANPFNGPGPILYM